MIEINDKKSIGRVLFIVEGSKTEFAILRKIFCDILKYEYIEKRRNRPDTFKSKNNSTSKVAVINTEESNINYITDSEEYLDVLFEMLRKKYDFPVINGSGTTGNHLGSDPMIIKEAIENAYSEDGVLIFGDIGSSILNSEMAIEFLDEEYNRSKIKIADAPIVEGTLIAMSINDGKTSLEDILEELTDLKNFNKV